MRCTVCDVALDIVDVVVLVLSSSDPLPESMSPESPDPLSSASVIVVVVAVVAVLVVVDVKVVVLDVETSTVSSVADGVGVYNVAEVKLVVVTMRGSDVVSVVVETTVDCEDSPVGKMVADDSSVAEGVGVKVITVAVVVLSSSDPLPESLSPESPDPLSSTSVVGSGVVIVFIAVGPEDVVVRTLGNVTVVNIGVGVGVGCNTEGVVDWPETTVNNGPSVLVPT